MVRVTEILPYRRIEVRAQLINVDHGSTREDCQDFLPGNGLTAPDRDHLGKRLTVQGERVRAALPQASRDSPGIGDELPDADICRLSFRGSHDFSIAARTTLYHGCLGLWLQIYRGFDGQPTPRARVGRAGVSPSGANGLPTF